MQPIVARRAWPTGSAFRPSASREQRCLAYKRLACMQDTFARARDDRVSCIQTLGSLLYSIKERSHMTSARFWEILLPSSIYMSALYEELGKSGKKW